MSSRGDEGPDAASARDRDPARRPAITAAGAGVLLATLNVKYRDVTVAIPLLMQLWLFATPVVYPGSLITGGWAIPTIRSHTT